MKTSYYDFCIKKYNLENLNYKVSQKKVILLIYDEEYYYYLKDNEFLEMDNDFNILKLIDNLNKKYLLEIINFYPVCLCKQTLVIALRTENVDNSKLQIAKYDEVNSRYQNLIKYHRANFIKLFASSNVKKEISMSRKYINRYKFHENYIKRYILTEKKRRKKEYNKLLDELIPNKKSIIDVSCGDNSDIFKIAKRKKYTTIVGNDICLNYLKAQYDENVTYTNDDIVLNRIKPDSYDVSFCKNTLHHMNNLTNINNILKFLDKISNEIIIIEISNPREHKGLPKFLNKYLYTKFLRDAGNYYLNESQFKSIIENVFKKHRIEYLDFTNILGTFMIAKISKENVNNENKSRNRKKILLPRT